MVEVGSSTTTLGNWYATVLPWKPQIAMLVNERTLVPVLMPLAPAANLAERFPGALADILAAHGIPDSYVAGVRHQQLIALAFVTGGFLIAELSSGCRWKSSRRSRVAGVGRARFAG